MNIIENLRLAITSLKAGKMRAFLTMLGIIIGISSVIAIFTVGNSLSRSISESMAEMGANQITIYVSGKESGVWRDLSESDLITNEMVEAAMERFGDELETIQTYEQLASGQVKDGVRYANVNITGVNENGWTVEGYDFLKGRDITRNDVQSGRNVAVVSDKLVSKMFPPNVDPLGQEVKIHTTNHGVITFSIVGVYEYKMPSYMNSYVNEADLSTTLIIPITTAQRIAGGNQGYDVVWAFVPPGGDSLGLSQRLEDFFGRYYERNTRFGIYVQNNENWIKEYMSMIDTVSFAISIIAGISLVVGGIGVMNIMLVSVTERTREIGTRKALGARNSAIRYQFIIESMIICLIGGFIGIGLGLILGSVGASLMGFPAAPSIGSIILAVTFSMIIGVFFGFYPANKAAKLDPIEALRYE